MKKITVKPLENSLLNVMDTNFIKRQNNKLKKDNERTRIFQKLGYEIIRFSGTEIYHRAYRCANEILSIIISKQKEE